MSAVTHEHGPHEGMDWFQIIDVPWVFSGGLEDPPIEKQRGIPRRPLLDDRPIRTSPARPQPNWSSILGAAVPTKECAIRLNPCCGGPLIPLSLSREFVVQLGQQDDPEIVNGRPQYGWMQFQDLLRHQMHLESVEG